MIFIQVKVILHHTSGPLTNERRVDQRRSNHFVDEANVYDTDECMTNTKTPIMESIDQLLQLLVQSIYIIT